MLVGEIWTTNTLEVVLLVAPLKYIISILVFRSYFSLSDFIRISSKDLEDSGIGCSTKKFAKA